MKRLVLAIAVVLAIVIAAFTGSAMADTITGYSGYGMNSTWAARSAQASTA